jgi:peptidyl-Asp metalloendopeptidase
MKSCLVRIVAAAALALLGQGAAAAGLPALFGASVTPRGALVLERADVRARTAKPDLGLLPQLAAGVTDSAEGPYFTLDLFDDVVFDAQVMRTERTADGGVAIIARLTALELGTAVLVQDGVAMSGSVTLPGGAYSILPLADGAVRITKVDQSLLPPDAEPRRRASVAPVAADMAATDAPVDTGKLIDVIVFWTPAAETAAGGSANIGNNINTAIANTNAAYLNSGIAQRLRLVAKQSVAYTEDSTGGDPFGNALDAITNGTIPNTATLRNTYGADEVVLVINDGTACGIGWLPSTISSANSDQGFAVVAVGGCLTTNFSFAHELGHNMGAHHDPYVLNPGSCPDGKEPGAFCYSRGLSYIGTSSGNSWRTIMAYNNQCAATVGGCVRLQYFSNPMVTYSDGNAMGDGPARNNALTLNKSANAVSNYRATVVPITASFSDVPLGDPFFGFVEFMYQGGYSGGCATAPLRYCPTDPITRGQMAVFLERTKRGALFSHTATGAVFTDVSVSTPFAGSIEQVSIDGITSGCAAGPAFCPADSVTRAAMAKFLLLAKCGAGYVPNTPASSPFADVLVGDPFLKWINKLYSLGVTSGCLSGPLRYCPTAPVTRAAMAKFIYYTFPYGTPSDVCTP